MTGDQREILFAPALVVEGSAGVLAFLLVVVVREHYGVLALLLVAHPEQW